MVMRKKTAYVLFVMLVVCGVCAMSLPTAGADHDMVYAPCDPEDTRSIDQRVWFIDYQSGAMLRFDDGWWGERPGLTGYTNWHHQCRLGMTGVWQAAPILPLQHPPTHIVESRDEIRSVVTTTTVQPAPTTTIPPEPAPAPDEPTATLLPEPVLPVDPVDGYDLFDAEWDGYPFEQTILLLEERYPPGTPDRYHFRLSIAVEFLRGGGMVRGLDNLWESG